MAIHVGSVYVEVLPDAGRFFTTLKSQVSPIADRIGRDIGKSISDDIAKGIRAGMEEGFGGRLGERQGGDTGKRFADAFEKKVQTRILEHHVHVAAERSGGV